MLRQKNAKQELIYGIRRGIPIAIGYLPVSFTFGLMAVSGGLPVWLAAFISLSNVTSAGQFAGTNLILAGSGMVEIMLTTFVINIRYMLMSFSLSQKMKQETTILQRLLLAFGITDETFSVASMENEKLSYAYMMGLISLPIAGWTLGTALGALVCSNLPENLSNAMGIALYGMFIAIIIPPAKKSKAVICVVGLAIAVVCIMNYLSVLSFVSSGFRVIIATILASAAGAWLFPKEVASTS